MMKKLANELSVCRAHAADCDAAWKIIEEYYEAVRVVARDTKQDFGHIYFREGAGVWLAAFGKDIAGCVALRRLEAMPHSGEVKRMYVRPQFRGRGIAAALYRALELYARESGYEWLYLDTTDEMLAAQKFYAALGYEITARYNENPQATIFMRKDLRVPFA